MTATFKAKLLLLENGLAFRYTAFRLLLKLAIRANSSHHHRQYLGRLGEKT